MGRKGRADAVLTDPDVIGRMADEQRKWREDPERFVRGFLGVSTLWSKQVEILESVRDNPRTCVTSGHDLGKTFLASCVTWWRLLAFTPSKVITTAPSQRQVQELLWSEVRSRYVGIERHMGGATGIPAPSALKWEGAPDWFAVGFATRPDDAGDHVTKFVGYHSPHLTLILDEAGGIAKPIWDAAEGLLTTAGARALAIGNPTDPRSEFAKAYKSRAWRSISMSAYDHPNLAPDAPPSPRWGVSKQWVEALRAKYGESSAAWHSKVLGLFPPTTEDTLISIGEVETCRRRPAAMSGRPAIGVDVARYGTDETVIAVVQGDAVVLVDVRQGQDTMWTAGRVLSAAAAVGLEQQEAARIVVDDTGVGGGVTDRLRELGWNVRGENFGSGPLRDPMMANRRTEMWWKMREWVRGSGSLSGIGEEAYDQLLEDLTAPKYEQRSDGRIALEPKAHVKSRIGRSPDWGDALALALAPDLGGQARRAPTMLGGSSFEDDDRLAGAEGKPKTFREKVRDWMPGGVGIRGW